MVFDKLWFEKHQSKLLFLLNNRFTKRWFRYVLRIRKCDCPIDTFINRIEPNNFSYGAKLKGDKIELKTDFRTHEKFGKRLYYAFKPLWWVMHGWDFFTQGVPEFNLGFDTLTAYSTPGTSVSGATTRNVAGSPENLATIRAGAGTNHYTDNYLTATIGTTASAPNLFAQLFRGYFLFDTSSLTSSANISAAEIDLYSTYADSGLGACELDIVSSSPASDTALANSDYGNIGGTPFSSVASTSITSSAYNAFTLDSGGRSNISKTGISKFGLRINWDTDNNFTGTWATNKTNEYDFSAGGAAGTTQDPKLVVTYTIPTGNNTFRSLMGVGK